MEFTREEFRRRFINRLVGIAGEIIGEDDFNVREYAEKTWESYWDDEDQRECGPEECAETDYAEWDEE